MRRMIWSLCVGVMGMGLLACGAPPPLSEIESNLNSPNATLSGSTIKTAFLSYDKGLVAMKMPGLTEYGKITGLLTVGEPRKTAAVPMKQYLLQSGVPANIADLVMPYVPVNDDLSLRKDIATTKDGEFGIMRQALPFKTNCVDGNIGGGLGGGSFRATIDLACQGVGSGRVSIYMEIKTDLATVAQGGNLETRLEISFQNACDNAGNCIDGAMIYKLGLSTSDHNAKGGMLMSMRFKATRSGGESVEVKQGLRMHFDTSQKAGKIEALVYVKNDEGREGTAVLVLEAAKGAGSFNIKGANGEVTCKSEDSGKTGKCFAQNAGGESATYSW